MKNILQRDNQKRDKKIHHKQISHCSHYIYLKLKKENNIKTMVLKIYL